MGINKAGSLIVKTGLFFVAIALSASSVLAQSNAVPARVTQLVNVHDLVTLHGNVHPLARPEFDQGAAPDDLPMERILLVLQRGADQEAALRQLLDDQQTKSSPQFHQWLTPEQFGQQFGPADSDIRAVTDWLTSQGFQVSKVSAGRTVIEFSGTAGLVRQALGTEIHKYAVNGKNYWANATDPQIPAALAPVVAGFASLHNFPRSPLYHGLGTFSHSKATGEVQPSFTFPVSCSGGSGTCYYFAVGPWDFATIYNVAASWSAGTDGTGQSIAIVGETNINPQDVADFRSMFGLPANAPNIILNGPDPGITEDEPEADLDVQWSGAVARGATIDLVVSETTEATAGVDLSAVYIIDNNLAPILSASYGACEAELGASGNLFHSTLWEQAAAQGISVLIAAGDSGSATCDRGVSSAYVALAGFSVNGFASTPFNVAVGGTDFADMSNPRTYWNLTNTSTYQSSALSYIPESTWNDTCAASGILTGCANASSDQDFQEGIDLAAGGGGPSNCINSAGTYPNFTCSGGYSKPAWQSGTGVPQDAARDVPDLSLFAGNGWHYSFYVFCEMDANASGGGSSTSCDLNSPYTDFQGAGGTSISVQAFAGIMALVNQRYGRQGNANYVLYPLAAQNPSGCNSSTTATTNSPCIFYDVTAGNNSVACAGGSPDCSNTISGQYGMLVSGNPPTAAWTTTTGYDLATGWGSVNVANLVNKWSSNFTPSTTTLALSTTPPTNPLKLTHGQPINFNVNVAPGSGSGTPTGDVSLVAQTGSSASNLTGIGPFTLSGGSVSGSTVMLPGGSYNVTAHYAGDGTFAASNSSPGIPVSVGQESSQTEVRLVTPNASGLPVYNVTTVPYGSVYILRMDVTNSSGQLCTNPTTGLISYPCPTGSLTVSPAPTEQSPPPGTVPGSYVLNSEGYAEDQPIQQTPGTYNFVATYIGDNSYTGSTSPPVPITITKAPTSMDIGVQPTTTFISGGTMFLSSYVYSHSNGAPLGGTVTYYAGNTPLSGQPLIVQNSGLLGYEGLDVTMSTPITGLGSVTITGQYSGDTNYAAASTPALVVNLTDYTVTSSPSSINISAPGQSASSTFTLTSENGFSAAVYLNVSAGCPPGATCTFSPSPVTVTGTTPGQSTLTITTTAPTSASAPTPPPPDPPSLRPWVRWLSPWLLIFALLTSLGLARRRAAKGLILGALLMVAVWVACGGGTGGVGGTGSEPSGSSNLYVSPNLINFNDQPIGVPSTSQSVLFSNSGNAAAGISNVGITGLNPADFSVANNCSGSLAGGSSCTMNVAFTPTASGNRNASLSFTTNANNYNIEAVQLLGTGVQPPPAAVLSPSNLTFSAQNEGTASPPQMVTLTNTGSSPLSISRIDTEGANYYDFNQTNNCSSSLAAGGSCTISVTFSPIGTGSCTASLGVYIGSSGSEAAASLSGTGVPLATPAGQYALTLQIYAIDGGVKTSSFPLTVQ